MDLSGLHEPTPRPGKAFYRDPASYFLVLTLRPDHSREKVEMGTQTDAEPADPVRCASGAAPSDRPLLYAALLSSKADAADAIKDLLAQLNDQHAGLPHTLFSDCTRIVGENL